MYFGISPVRPMVAPKLPNPAYQPRVVTREVVVREPPRIVNRTVYTPGATRFVPGPTVTRNFYNTVVRPDYGAMQRARTAQANWDREHFRLERMRDRDSMARLAFLQQQLQAAQAAAQAAAAQQQPPVAVQNMPQPMPSVSPASPAVDLSPQQDAAAADGGGGGGAQDAGGGDGGGGGEPSHKPHHLLLFVGLIGAAGVGGYLLMKKKKTAKKPD